MVSDRRYDVIFYRLGSDREPVREWLRGLDKEAKTVIGEDVKTLQLGWPLGMPLARKMEPDLWELRSEIRQRITRIFFTIVDRQIVLLHGFEKTSRKTPGKDLALARRRLADLRRNR
jgi:phage-related protein